MHTDIRGRIPIAGDKIVFSDRYRASTKLVIDTVQKVSDKGYPIVRSWWQRSNPEYAMRMNKVKTRAITIDYLIVTESI